MADELGQSAVPYSPTIIEKKIQGADYTPTLLEYLYAKGEQYTFDIALAGVGGSTLYTIPENKVGLVTSAYLSYETRAVTGLNQLIFGVNPNFDNILTLRSIVGGAGRENTGAVSLAYTFPIIIPSGNIIRAFCSSDQLTGAVTIILLPKELISGILL